MTSEQEQQGIRYAALLAEISGSAVNIMDASHFLDENVERIGRSVGASYVCFAVLPSAGTEAAVHVWHEPGRGGASFVEPGGWLLDELSAGRSVCLGDAAAVPDAALRGLFAARGAASAMIVPVFVEHGLGGLLWIECPVPTVWPGSVVALFRAIAHTLRIVHAKAMLRLTLTRQKQQYGDMLNAMPGLVYVTDMDTYEIVFANESAIGHFSSSILGQPCYKALQGRDAPCECCCIEAIRHSDEPYSWRFDSPVLQRSFQVTDKAITLPDGKRVRFSFQSDVTDLVQAQTEMVRAQQQAEASSDFLARMSHEIRTPMNAIIGFTHLLGRTSLDAGQQDYLNKTRIAANGLLHIINDILDFSRIEAGKMSVESVPFRLSVLLAAVQSIMGFNAKEKRLDFVVDVAPEVPDVLLGDPGRINQVLLNLLSNAIKFTQSGEVRVSVVPVTIRGRRITLAMQVSDTGIGMDEEQAGRLFQPFNQADGTVVRNFGGTGLGLVISRRLVELMGGTISLTSAPGKGTTFSFTLELETGDEQQQDLAALHAGDDDSHYAERLRNIAGARVLVVDDNAINLEIARELLEAAGMIVQEAGGGEEAIAMVRAEAFDMVFMDMLMPDVDGLEATRRIRELSFHLPRVAGLPIVAMTANVMAADRERCFAAGMNDHIAKPLDPAELAYCLLHWIPARV